MSSPAKPDPWPTGHTVFRRVPGERLAEVQATTRIPVRAADAWWELVDAAVDSTGPAAGVAVTRERDADVEVVALWTPGNDDGLNDVVRELVAALRRTDARTMTIRPDGSRTARMLTVLLDEDLLAGPTGPFPTGLITVVL